MEWLSPSAHTVSLTLVPVFDAADPYRVAITTADSLLVLVLRKDSSGVFRDTVGRARMAIDPDSGTASGSIDVVLLQSPQLFLLVLRAYRSSDHLVLFSGTATVTVYATSSGKSQEVPVNYVGPRPSRITIAPKDTSLTGTGSFAYRVTGYNDLGAVIPGAYVSFFLVDPTDSTKLLLGKFSGVATAVPSAVGVVRVYSQAPGGVTSDTARVFLGAVPQSLRVTPGYANIGPTDTLTFTAQLLDAIGNPVTTTGVTWLSRTPSVASIGANGKVTAVIPGTAVLVGTASGFLDSAQVTVAPLTNVVVSTTSQGRTFRVAKVDSTVVVDVAVDMHLTPAEKLGSYNATLGWNPAVLQFIDVTTGGFAAPTVNSTAAASGQLRFSAADPTGSAGSVVVASVRFKALAPGTSSPALTISEMSAAGTFTNLFALNRVTVTSGSVTVRP
jgi:hypothetical protein